MLWNIITIYKNSKAELSASLPQSLVSHDTSETILIFWFKKHLLSILKIVVLLNISFLSKPWYFNASLLNEIVHFLIFHLMSNYLINTIKKMILLL